MTVYVLKDEQNQLWCQPSRQAATIAWAAWREKARARGIPALLRFERNFAPYARGIIASADWRLNTSVLEGINNRINVVKHMAYGFRDDTYFFLKIRAAFPGKPG